MKRIFCLIIFFMLIIFAAQAADIYVVDDIQAANKLAGEAFSHMNAIGIRVKGKIQFHFVDSPALDAVWEGPRYVGVEPGMYKYKDGIHHIYILKNIDSDTFLGICGHEYAHAWQAENCPSGQDKILREGFARWCEIKTLEADGAYLLARKYRLSADWNYRAGYTILLRYEDKNGQQAVIDMVKTVKDIQQLAPYGVFPSPR